MIRLTSSAGISSTCSTRSYRSSSRSVSPPAAVTSCSTSIARGPAAGRCWPRPAKTLGAESTPDGGFRFYAEGPDKTEAVVRVRLRSAPKEVKLDGHPLPANVQTWDAPTHTVRLRFPNAATGRCLNIR